MNPLGSPEDTPFKEGTRRPKQGTGSRRRRWASPLWQSAVAKW